MLLCSWRNSRRTLAMVSTINIPGWLPDPAWVREWKKGAGGGSRLDADQPVSRVLLPRRSSSRGYGVVADESRDDLGGKLDVVRGGTQVTHCEQSFLSGRPCWKRRPGSLWSGSPICSDRRRTMLCARQLGSDYTPCKGIRRE